MSRCKFGKTQTQFDPPPHRPYTNTSQVGNNLLAADPELARIAANGLRDYASLSEHEKVRFVATFMSFLLYSQNAFLKWREGLLKPALWLSWEQVMMNLFGAPGGKVLWKERNYLFGEEFRRYIENDLMKREPHPDAKPLGAFSISQPQITNRRSRRWL